MGVRALPVFFPVTTPHNWAGKNLTRVDLFAYDPMQGKKPFLYEFDCLAYFVFLV